MGSQHLDGRVHLLLVEVDGHRLDLRIRDGHRVLPEVLRQLDAEGVTVDSAEVVRPTLDDVFLALTGRSLREEGTVAEHHDDQEVTV